MECVFYGQNKRRVPTLESDPDVVYLYIMECVNNTLQYKSMTSEAISETKQDGTTEKSPRNETSLKEEEFMQR